MTEQEKLRYKMAKLNWILILKAATDGRRTSWAENPVVEWRNASDEVYMAVINAMERAGILPNSRKELKAWARKQKI